MRVLDVGCGINKHPGSIGIDNNPASRADVICENGKIKAVGARGSDRPLRTFLHLDPKDAIFTPVGICSKDRS